MDEPIEDLTLSNNRVLENSNVGAVIGILAAHDPDAHNDTSIAFAIIHPTYSPFFLRGKNKEILVVNGSLNYEENSDYVITIGVTDSQDRYFQAPFVIHIVGRSCDYFVNSSCKTRHSDDFYTASTKYLTMMIRASI